MVRVIRGRLLASLWLLMWLPLQAAALSLGDLVVHSLPGEPLRAHIPFTLLPGETLTEVRVTIATAEEYQRRNLPRAELLQGLSPALLDKGEGRGRVQLFTQQPWLGDEVQLLLMISWSKGRMERQYQMAAVTSAAESTPVYVEVAKDETLDEIAIRLSKGRNRSYLHMMYALFLANPEAFYRGNMNNLKTGLSLRVPSDEALYRLSDREVFDGIRQQYEQWQQLREATGPRGSQAGAALAGMSSEQEAALDLSGDATVLQQRLQQVTAESEAIRQENEALHQRLMALEQRMQSVAGQVLEYAGGDEPPTPLKSPAKSESPAVPEPSVAEPEGVSEEGLSASAMFGAIVLVLLFVFYIWYSTGHPHRGRS